MHQPNKFIHTVTLVFTSFDESKYISLLKEEIGHGDGHVIGGVEKIAETSTSTKEAIKQINKEYEVLPTTYPERTRALEERNKKLLDSLGFKPASIKNEKQVTDAQAKKFSLMRKLTRNPDDQEALGLFIQTSPLYQGKEEAVMVAFKTMNENAAGQELSADRLTMWFKLTFQAACRVQAISPQ